MEKELWADVFEYKWLYQVSTLGRIKRLEYTAKHYTWCDRVFTEKILKPQKHRQWYLLINLRDESRKSKTQTVHRLVAQAFIENIDNKEQVNHKNWIKHDNNVNNLEWVTRSENAIHSYRVLWNTSKKK